MLSFLTEFEGKELASVAKGGLISARSKMKLRKSNTKKPKPSSRIWLKK
jgi:hypothetical protein